MNLSHPPRSARAAVVAACALILVAGRADAASPAIPHGHLRPGPVSPTADTVAGALVANDDPGGDDDGDTDRDDPSAAFAQQARMKTAPGDTVGPGALVDARIHAGRLPTVPTSWSEVTNVPLRPEDKQYADPVASNFGAGFGLNGGRVSSLAVDGHTVYQGAAGGGLWRSDDDGRHWRPLSDHQQTLSMGALAVNPADHSLWIGTGEPSNSGDSYTGLGIYRSTDRGRTWQQVGKRIDGSVVPRITFDGQGHVYAATNEGVLRRDTDDVTSDWTVALAPGAPDTRMSSAATDVAVRPGTGGRQVTAVIARQFVAAGDANGVYQSDDHGKPGTWHKITPTGDLTGVTPGRSTLSYSADGHALYALVGDASGSSDEGAVYRSATGDAAGPWTTVADEDVLKAAGAQNGDAAGAAWYNQYVAVDPADPNHVYAAFSEVFESWDAGKTWATIGPYWNFGLKCYTPGTGDGGCPMTTHADQHAIAFGPDHRVYFGNDGGVYERSATLRPDPALPSEGWTNLNQDLRTLQYYDAAYGRDPATGALSTWGGTQDNGTVLSLPGARELYEPAGGDGGYVIVDPANADRAVYEYVTLAMGLTTNGGRSGGTENSNSFTNISPACDWNADLKGCDPGPEFIAPYTSDTGDLNHWVAGGRYVWDNGGKGWDTRCPATSCDWTNVHDTGEDHSVTALAANGSVTYAGWEDFSGAQYTSGIDTDAGGTWHRLAAPLPNRYVTSLTVDPRNARHVWATYGGFTRSYVPGAGEGHVFESTDGGTTWTDRSGDLPDAPTGALALWHGHVVVGTDVGVFAAAPTTKGGYTWYRLGGALPNAGIVSLDVSPDGTRLLVATHGRGLWSAVAPL